MSMPLTGSIRPVRWCLAAGATTFWLGAAAAQPPAAEKSVPLALPRPAAAAAPAPAPHTLPLAECIAIAMDRQPTIRAANASLSAALSGQRALANMHPFTTILVPDLPVRRQQSEQGVVVAAAEVRKARDEAAHDVALLYYWYIYARQQEQTATDVIEQMNVWYGIAKELLNQGSLKGGQFTIYTMEEAIAEARKLRITAQTGRKLALAAFREAMGVDPTACDIVPRETELPVMGGSVTQDQVVSLALANRPEVIQAAAGVDVFRLEVCAQDRIRQPRSVPTLASGSDLHARQVPMAIRNGEYKPGALAPEMPPNLVGKRADRVARAADYAARQDEVLAKTRDLIRLEAINAYLGWHDAAEKMAEAKERFERNQKQVKLARENIQNLKYDEVVKIEALAGKSQGEYVEAVFQHIKALLRLQRVTAGGVAPAFPAK